ncbi:ParA family protein [Corynebacterium diphtheriae]|nr:ParA family protein [Corynebacterium diphtheriae]
MTTIAICNVKGGTGKTTSTIFLATYLADQGYGVTVLDADPQGSATDWALIAEENGHALPFTVQAVNARSISARQDTTNFSIIDCPPGNPAIIEAALKAADAIIIPTSPSAIEAQRMWETLELIQDTPAAVLLTSAQLNTRTLSDLQGALDAVQVPTFTNIICARQAIKRMWGQRPEAYHGYDTVAEEILNELIPQSRMTVQKTQRNTLNELKRTQEQ